MEYRVLGPLEVDGVALGGPRRRAVLTVLLLRANEPVSADRLVADVWGEEAADLKALQVAVSRLRHALGAEAIETTASGYRLRVAPGELDLERFERTAADGREALAAGRPEHAAEQLRAALALWRGPPLADLVLANAVGALRWAFDNGADEAGADLVIAWGPYWHECGRFGEGLAWAEQALERDVDADRRARLRYTRALLTGVRRLGRFRADLNAALAHFRATDDAAAIAECLGLLAFGHAWVGEYEPAGRLACEAVRCAERSGDDVTLSQALKRRALTAETFDDMAAAARPALVRLRRLGHRHQLAELCSTTGFVAIAERRERDALAWLEEGLEAARASSGDELPVVLGNLGLAKLLLGDLDAAEAALVEATVHAWSHDYRYIDETLLALAAVYGLRGDLDRAAVLSGVAAAHPTPGLHPDEERVLRRLNDELLGPVRERADGAAWERAAARGAAMSVREVVDFVRRRDAAAV